ncbi:MAG: hypothetical protein ISS01_02470 [Nanoarchaeota archaeon]|nr:hypothetical protein [Nanoarchaeota archaeon]
MVHHWIQVMFHNKRGDIAWEYIAAFILIIIVLIVIIAFSSTLKTKAIEGITYLFTGVLGK